jgi:hypothetical protein
MADFEPDEKSTARATALAARMMEHLRQLAEEAPPYEVRRSVFTEQRYAEQAKGVPITDVVSNLRRMATEFAVARRWDGAVPCLKLEKGEMVPISITEFLGGPWPQSLGVENWIEWYERYEGVPFKQLNRAWREALRGGALEGRFVVADIRKIEHSVQRNLSSFLSYRFAGIEWWTNWIRGVGGRFPGGPRGPASTQPPPAVGPGGGLQVQVSCLTPGLRIHIAPSYFISWVFFGSPSTPVTSYVLPGRYVFAGDGPMLPTLTQDPAVFNIPPTYHPALSSF